MTKKEKLRNTIAYYLLFISLGFSLGITGPALPSLAEQTGSTLGAIGAIFLLGALGGMLGTAVSGRIFDRVTRGNLVLGLAQLTSAILLAIMPLAGSLPLLLVIFLINGLPGGIINTGANTLLMWTHGKKAGPYMNGLHFAFGLGAFLAPTVFAQVLNLGGTYQHAYWALAVLAFPVGLFNLFSPGSPEHPDKREDSIESQVKLRQVLPVVIIAMMFLFFYVGSEITFGNWIYTYALILGLADATRAAYLTSGFWLAFTIGRAISIVVATRFKPEQILTVAFLGGLGALALAIITPNSISMLWAATLLVGFFMAPIWATGYNLAGQSIKLTATISSSIILGDSLGGVVLPWVTGQAIERFGARTMPWLVFSSLAINALVFGIMLLQRRKTLQVAFAGE
ncbi:MAG: MFS transporter [Ardenticatenaceae bacterium]|nr:MFS transporter [Ardenticatenaceae bacterium]MCB9445909.1 MFS transporter [Ardenticatenaceae bacterium]